MDSTSTTGRDARREALVRRAQAGEHAAFEQLAERYRAAVRALAFSRTGDHDLADDLAQEALVLAWRNLPSLADPAAFPAWLRRVALNACRSWYRASRPWPVSLDDCPGARLTPDTGPTPLAAALARAEARELRAALLMLPEANRYALLMHAWGRYTYDEIAEFLQVPASTIDGRIRRARARLRALLAPLAGDPLAERRTRRPPEEK